MTSTNRSRRSWRGWPEHERAIRRLAIAAALKTGLGVTACDGGTGSSGAKRVGGRIMTVGVSGNDLHPVSGDEAKRLEHAAAELIIRRLQC